jgi:hypothetical protein
MDRRPICAPYHSIIGDRGRGDMPNSSDGVVPYESSHLEGAQSESIVPVRHTAFDQPATVAEVDRILRADARGNAVTIFSGLNPPLRGAQWVAERRA